MKKKSAMKKLFMLFIAVCMIVPFGLMMIDRQEVQASEMSAELDGFTGENPYSNEVIMGMDENGNIYEWTDEIDTVSGIALFSRGPMIVDFHTKDSSQTTSYTEYGTGKSGYLNGAYGADAVYLGEENGKIKFMMSGVTGLVSPSEVNLLPWSGVQSFSHYQVNSNGYLTHYITTNVNDTSYASRLNNGIAPSYLKQGVKYLSYDGHYFYTVDQYEVMQQDCNAGHRNHAINASNPYYNYYQFLSFRSISNYSGAELKSIINNNSNVKGSNSKLLNVGTYFVDNQEKYGVNALLAAGIACNESAWGKSNICQTKNNLFGINAVDSSPGVSANTFSSPAACIKDYMETYLSNRYCRPGYMHYNGAYLGNKASGANVKYASDPYWGEKAAAIVWQLDNASGNKDLHKYTIGVKNLISTDHSEMNVRNQATTGSSSTVLYSTTLSGHAFTILHNTPVNDFYKIASEGVLNSAKTAFNTGTGTYDYENMYLYASANHIKIVSVGENQVHDVSYSAHVSEIGWMGNVGDGAIGGTVGQSLSMEALRIEVDNIEELGVSYKAYVKGHGWQGAVTDGKVAGTTGQSRFMEAVQISLTGKNAGKYDIYYQAHVAEVGWLGWAKNGESAGSIGYSYPMQAIRIKIVEKDASAPGSTKNPFMDKGTSVEYSAHVSEIGWMNAVSDGKIAGTTGRSLAMEAIKINVSGSEDVHISYSAHVSEIGWMNAVSDGKVGGTTGRSLHMEAIKISLSGDDANKYDVYYQAHVAEVGWLDWAKNGEPAGSAGYSYPMESIKIQLVKKGAAAPGSTGKAFIDKNASTTKPSTENTTKPSTTSGLLSCEAHVSEIGWMNAVSEGSVIGTTGRSLSLEAVKLSINSKEDIRISYSAHVSEIGWMSAVRDGAVAGTTGRSLSMEAITISLSGTDASKYDIYYRAHVSEMGWLDWAKNGEKAGSAGYSLDMEAIDIRIVPKGSTSPGTTTKPFVQK